MEAQSSPHNDKPASDLNALFEELELERKQPKVAPPVSGPRPSSAAALVGGKLNRNVPPPPPSLRPSLRAPLSADRTEQIDDLIEPDPLLPKYDAELDDAPTVARSSPLSMPLTSRPTPPPSRLVPPPSSMRLPPPPSARPRSLSPSAVARLSAPAAPLKSAADLPLPNKSALPALTPPPASRRSMPVPSRPAPSIPSQALSQPTPSAPPISLPPSSVVVREVAQPPSLSSIVPVTRSDIETQVTRPRKRKSGAAWLAAIGGVAILAGLAGVGYVFKDELLARAGAATPGALIVTVAGSKDAPVAGLRVLVDGKEACTGSPCRLALSAGTHFVRAEAPGFAGTADRAVTVDRTESSLHIALTPLDAPKAVAQESSPEPAKPSAPVLDLDQGAQPASAPAKPALARPAQPLAAAKPVAGKPAAKKQEAEAAGPSQKPAATGTGTLNINSIPVASVVLDGRPVGSTPLMGLSVSAGSHSVVFVHPELGRKATGVKVEAGKSATAAVRF